MLFAVFAAALGYGTLVPLVPVYLRASGGGNIAWHTGALPAAFLVAASVFSPLWGHLSDRAGRRGVIVCGSAGAIIAAVPFFLEHGVPQLYVFQVLAGAAFGAVVPAALGLLYESGDAQSQARRVAWFGTALLGGYLVGPALGGWLAGLADGGAALAAHQIVRLALGVQAGIEALAGAMVYLTAAPSARPLGESLREITQAGRALVALPTAVLVSLTLGGFEIAATLHLRGPLGLGSREVAGLFIACGVAMALTQLALLPRVSAASPVAWAHALVVASAGILAAMAVAASYAGTLLLGALIGAGLGLALGLLGLHMASVGGARRGFALGLQSSALSAGQAAGSMLGGALFAALGERALPAFGAAVVALALSLSVLEANVRRRRL